MPSDAANLRMLYDELYGFLFVLCDGIVVFWVCIKYNNFPDISLVRASSIQSLCDNIHHNKCYYYTNVASDALPVGMGKEDNQPIKLHCTGM